MQPQEELKKLRIKQTTLGKDLADKLVHDIPVLKDNVPYRNFFLYLGKGYHYIDKETKLHIIPHERVLLYAGSKYTSSGKFLDDYQRDVSPAFTYRNYYYQYEKCRQILNPGVEDIIEKNILDNNRVYAETLRKATPRSKADAARMMKSLAKELTWRYDDARKIAHYHLGHSLADFLEPYTLNLKHVVPLAEVKSIQQIKLVIATYDMPLPIYKPVLYSPRPFAEGVQFMEKEIRNRLYPSWFDVDLKHCQLSIVAARFGITSIQNFLESEKSIWRELLIWMEIPDRQWIIAKPWLKKALYSLIFGKRSDIDERDLEKELKKKTIIWQQPFITHPLMQDLDQALKKARKDIIANKGMNGAYGWMIYDEKRDIDSFLAEVIQGYELKLITPIYDVALKEKKNNHTTFDIMLHQFDGVSIQPCDGINKEFLMTKLNKPLIKLADKEGIITSLVSE